MRSGTHQLIPPIEETKMLTNRLSLIVALVAIAALALFTVSMVALPHPSAGTNLADQAELQHARNYIASADRSYEQIELQHAQNYAAEAARQASLDQRHGEQAIGAAAYSQASSRAFREAEQAAALADAERAYQLYRQGERTAGYVEDSASLNSPQGEWSGK
jgi:hypothetical protein